MCLLEAGLLEPVQAVYNRLKGTFEREKLMRFIERFREIYADLPSLCELIGKLLELDENKRVDFVELGKSLPSWNEVRAGREETKEDFKTEKRDDKVREKPEGTETEGSFETAIKKSTGRPIEKEEEPVEPQAGFFKMFERPELGKLNLPPPISLTTSANLLETDRTNFYETAEERRAKAQKRQEVLLSQMAPLPPSHVAGLGMGHFEFPQTLPATEILASLPPKTGSNTIVSERMPELPTARSVFEKEGQTPYSGSQTASKSQNFDRVSQVSNQLLPNPAQNQLDQPKTYLSDQGILYRSVTEERKEIDENGETITRVYIRYESIGGPLVPQNLASPFVAQQPDFFDFYNLDRKLAESYFPDPQNPKSFKSSKNSQNFSNSKNFANLHNSQNIQNFSVSQNLQNSQNFPNFQKFPNFQTLQHSQNIQSSPNSLNIQNSQAFYSKPVFSAVLGGTHLLDVAASQEKLLGPLPAQPKQLETKLKLASYI